MIEIEGLEKLDELKKDIGKSKTVAARKTGYMMSEELERFVVNEIKPPLHPMSNTFRRKRNGKQQKGNPWPRSRKKDGPVAWLGKYSSYRVLQNGDVKVDFHQNRDSSEDDRFLGAVVRRIQRGENVKVSKGMRRLFGATRQGRKDATPGIDFFPLRKETSVLKVPPRKIFSPFANKVRVKAQSNFKKEFISTLREEIE